MTTYSYQPLLPYADYLQAYFSQLGGDIAILGRVAAQFAAGETSPPGMTLLVAAGAAFRSGSVIEVPARVTTTIVAPTGNPRIDRVVINMTTDALVVVQGVEASVPTAPLVPAGHLPLARIALTPGMTAITNTAITDERLNGGVATMQGSGLVGVQTFTTSGTYTATPGTTKIIVRVVGGGGSGGSCSATSSSQGSAASGGGAGAYVEALLASGFADVAITIGAGGLPSAGGNNAGSAGGTSRFGSIVIAPGGTPGYGSPALNPPFLFGGTGASPIPTGGNVVNAAGQTGAESIALAPNVVVGGIGGSSIFGAGGRGAGWGDGFPAQAPGAGGGGASAISSQPAFRGGPGAAGIVIVSEYS